MGMQAVSEVDWGVWVDWATLEVWLVPIKNYWAASTEVVFDGRSEVAVRLYTQDTSTFDTLA